MTPHGGYAQERWTLGRLTTTAGIRVQWLRSSVRPVSVGAGRFVGARSFAEVTDVPKWGPDLSPRVGLAYDLFGNSKTALKFSFGKYFTRVMTTYAKALNPMAVVTSSLPWSDRDLQGRGLPTNGDGVAQDDLVTAAGATGFAPPEGIRADQILIDGVRLPFFKFPQNPELL